MEHQPGVCGRGHGCDFRGCGEADLALSEDADRDDDVAHETLGRVQNGDSDGNGCCDGANRSARCNGCLEGGAGKSTRHEEHEDARTSSGRFVESSRVLTSDREATALDTRT